MGVRQGNDAEVVGAYPVEPRSLDKQDFFAHEQVVDEFHVVMDTVHFGVDFREHIKCPHRLDAGYAGNLVDKFPRFIALLQQAAAGQDEFVDALIAAQSGLDGVLHGRVGA